MVPPANTHLPTLYFMVFLFSLMAFCLLVITIKNTILGQVKSKCMQRGRTGFNCSSTSVVEDRRGKARWGEARRHGGFDSLQQEIPLAAFSHLIQDLCSEKGNNTREPTNNTITSNKSENFIMPLNEWLVCSHLRQLPKHSIVVYHWLHKSWVTMQVWLKSGHHASLP